MSMLMGGGTHTIPQDAEQSQAAPSITCLTCQWWVEPDCGHQLQGRQVLECHRLLCIPSFNLSCFLDRLHQLSTGRLTNRRSPLHRLHWVDLRPLVASLQLARVSGASLELPGHTQYPRISNGHEFASRLIRIVQLDFWCWKFLLEGFGRTAKKRRERVILRTLTAAVWQNLSSSVYCTPLLFCVCYFFL